MAGEKLQPTPEPTGLRFANETARIVYQTMQEVKSINRDLPHDEQDNEMHLVEVDSDRGLTVVLTAGPGVFTTLKRTYFVPNRTLRVLSEMGIDSKPVDQNELERQP